MHISYSRYTHFHGIVFAELVSYLEDVYADADISPVFKLIDLAKLYQLRLKQLGIKENRVYTTRLKGRLLDALPGLTAYSEGRDILLTFNEHIGMR